MPKKVKHFPSDFSRKPAASQANSPAAKRAVAKDQPKESPKETPKKHRRSKRSFLAEDQKKGSQQKRAKSAEQPKPQKSTQATANSRFPENDHPYFQSTINAPAKPKKKADVEQVHSLMPLNKFIAHCGICSRRDAVELIKKGKVKVNSLVEVNPAVKVSQSDYVIYEGKRIFPQKNLVYYLLNKPKNYITTTEDPEDRNTVLDLFKGVDTSRLYPVGRLDRNTTGLLLMTNDGELAQRLSHPKYNIRKVYQVTLDKALTRKDFERITQGVTLEDGLAPVDEIAYINPKDKKQIGIQIHIGRNRIVRRIFEHLQYKVVALDRVVYAGLTKKNIPRGTYRQLDEKEILYLKHFK